MGLVDVTLVLRYSWFCTYGKCAFFSTEAECLKLVEWAKGCVMLESVAESLAKQKKNYDLILVLAAKKKMELDYKPILPQYPPFTMLFILVGLFSINTGNFAQAK
ncbi:hypothetical protein WN943_012225 [Citrus x changshan-huyou]